MTLGYEDVSDSVFVLTLASPITSIGDLIKVSCAGGTLSSADGFLLESFSNKPVENKLSLGPGERDLSRINVYPNPFTHELIVECSAAALFDEIRLFDISGREVDRIKTENRTFITLSTSGLAKGFFTLQFMKDGGIVEVRKIMKE